MHKGPSDGPVSQDKVSSRLGSDKGGGLSEWWWQASSRIHYYHFREAGRERERERGQAAVSMRAGVCRRAMTCCLVGGLCA